ncbi:unnamed protein product [Allacma fusca]|uniref:Uncharacterized protein n=1 Tax=Allacma fusca TaxID=39272 RepID=A0A8J2PDQ0_9HEXA|nr:unnamed protein product [Allacma fusca]
MSVSNLYEKSEKAFVSNLRQWAIEENVPHKTLSKLLKNLNCKLLLNNLPFDARSFLGTPRVTIVSEIKPGNVDGLPLAKSSGSRIWPIQCRIVSVEQKPFIVGIYHGDDKPDDSNEYLRAFVDEAQQLLNSGLFHPGKHISVSLRAIIADAPARSFITKTTGHTGYFACSKCDQKGTYSNRRVVFESQEAESRTNESVRSLQQLEFYSGNCILDQLNVGFVTDIPFEYLHLILLGGTKRLLNLWAHSSSLKGRLMTILEARQKAIRIVESDASSSDTEAPRMRKLPVRFAESSNSAKRAKHVSRTQTHVATASFPPPPPKALQSTNEQIGSTSRTVPHVPIGIISAEQLPTKESENGFEKLVLAGIAVLKVRIRAIEDAQTIILEQIHGLEVKIGSDPDAYSDLANSLDWIESIHSFFGKVEGNQALIQDAIKDWLKAAPTRFKRQLGQTRGEEILLDEERDEDDSLLN